MIFLVVLLFIASSVFFYVEAFKVGLSTTKWAIAGLILGPLALPMFSISAHVAWRRDVGFGNLYIGA